MAPASCSRCGESHAVATYPSINTALDPDLKARVRDGSLFVWECPHCGARNLLKYQTLYHDPAEKLMVWLLPGDAEPPQAVADAVKELDGYTLRLVREVGDLVEKVNIHACGLDDVLVEMCKYVTRLEMADAQNRPDIQDAPLKFFKMDVTGSRVMGGGFGGCTINLVKDELYLEFVEAAMTQFTEKFGHAPKIYNVVISDGARKL